MKSIIIILLFITGVIILINCHMAIKTYNAEKKIAQKYGGLGVYTIPKWKYVLSKFIVVTCLISVIVGFAYFILVIQKERVEIEHRLEHDKKEWREHTIDGALNHPRNVDEYKRTHDNPYEKEKYYKKTGRNPYHY